MDDEPMGRFDDAVRLAVSAHAGMRRKGDGVPYVTHPLEVAAIAATLTDDEDVLCAAVLHDVVEDADITLDELAEAFGGRVASLVAQETEDKRPDQDPAATWLVRKRESLDELRAATDPGVAMVWLADKLSNMRSFARLREREGDGMWRHFNQRDPALHAWYYRSVAQATSALRDSPAWREYVLLTDRVFEGVSQDDQVC